MGVTRIQPEPRLIIHPALLRHRCWPGCRAGRISLYSFLHPSILQAMLHVASGEHDQADNDQAGQGPNPFRFRRRRATDPTNYAVEVRIGDVRLVPLRRLGAITFLFGVSVERVSSAMTNPSRPDWPSSA